MTRVKTTIILWRRGNAAEWIAANPVLKNGEAGYESDTKKFKIGDGITHWTSLHYFVDQVFVQTLIDNAVIDGVQGPKGDDGDSAYEIAVQNGFVGTESQWLTSLHGVNGTNGTNGAQGSPGAKGDKGDKGDTGDTGPQGLQGNKGDTGDPGADGTSYTGPPLTASSTPPSSPAVGNLWVDLSS